MTSRRRRAPPRQTGQDRSTQATAPQGGPSNPALIKDRISTTSVINDDLHFKTGLWGWLARFFVRLRAAGDPYDETLVLPALIVIITMKLHDLNRLDAWAVAAAMMGTAIIAGAWLGAYLNPRSGFRFVLRMYLRAISAGAIESAGYALVYAGTFKFSSSVAANIILLNMMMYWFGGIAASIVHHHAVITETEWQTGRARLALLRNVIRGQSIYGGLRSPQATIRSRMRRWWQAGLALFGEVIRFISQITHFLIGLLAWLAVLSWVAQQRGISLEAAWSHLLQFAFP